MPFFFSLLSDCFNYTVVQYPICILDLGGTEYLVTAVFSYFYSPILFPVLVRYSLLMYVMGPLYYCLVVMAMPAPFLWERDHD